MQENRRDREAASRAYELGCDYERRFYGCSQCVVAAVQDALGVPDDRVFRAATGLAGGGALSGDGTCGALAGGVMVLGQLHGRERADFDDPRGVRQETFALARQLKLRFEERFGASLCREVQAGLFGRSFDLTDPRDFERFEQAGGHRDKCPVVVGSAASMTVEIVLEAGLLPSG